MIRGYVDVTGEFEGVTVRHPLLVVEGLAIVFIIARDIMRA